MWANPLSNFDEAELERLKKAFALAWLYEPEEPFKAALKVFAPDTGKALWVSQKWTMDEAVAQEKERLLNEHGSLYFLPDKTRIAREVYDLAANEKKSGSEKLQFYKLYCDMMGFIEPKTNINNGIINNNQGAKVMVIKDHGSNEQWEQKTRDQQAKLRQEAMQDIG